jgi:hypothetical protein
MTVKELKQKLSEYSDNDEVVFRMDDNQILLPGEYYDIQGLYTFDEKEVSFTVEARYLPEETKNELRYNELSQFYDLPKV